jgi:O-antigen ligase
MKNKDRVLYGLFVLFFISLFLSRLIAADIAAMAILVVFSIAIGSFKEKIRLFKERKYLWLMLTFAGIMVLSFFLSENRQYGLQLLIRRLPLLLFPISIGLLQLTRERRNKLLLSLGITVTIACFLSLIYAIYRYRQSGDAAWLYNDSLSYFIGQQSIYSSVFVNISIYIFTWFLLYSRLPVGYKCWIGIGILFLFIISYLLASRNMMLFLYVTVFFFAFYGIIKKRKYLEGFTLLAGIILGAFLIFKIFPKTLNRFKELTYTQFNYQHKGEESHYNLELTADQWNGANFRLAAWPCGWELFKKHPVLGVGLGDKKDKLFEVYRQKQFHFALDTRKNVHNNYLDILYSTGLIGFIFFLAGWVLLPLLKSIRTQDGLAFLMILTISLAMLTENYFDRSLGAMLTGFLIPFLLTGRENPSPLKEEDY